MLSLKKASVVYIVNFALLIFITLSFASNSYCPERVTCTSDNILQSCQCIKNGQPSNDWEVFSDERVSSPSKVRDIMKGDYIFHNARINQVDANTTSTNCSYVISPDINNEERVFCVAKSNNILPVFPDSSMLNSAWKTDQNGDDKYYYCGTYNFPVSLLQCPINTDINTAKR